MKFRRGFRAVGALGGLAFLIGAGVALAAEGNEAAAPRKKLVMLIAEPEYDTLKSLPEFAEKFLAKDFETVVVSGPPEAGGAAFDQISAIAGADVLLVSVRRHTPPAAQMAMIRKFVAAGKPVVGIRTACHAFARAAKQELPAGCEDWADWDAQVIGGHYTNHYGHGPITRITAAVTSATDAGEGAAILRGVALPFDSAAWFYKVSPLRAGAKPLLIGEIPGQPTEPIAWTFARADGGKTFFTSLGTPEDFKNASFQQLLRNGIRWAAGVTADR